MRLATKANLVDQTGMAVRSVMRCSVCGEEFSANRGDYFMVPEDHVFKHHEQPMFLVVPSRRFRHLDADEER